MKNVYGFLWVVVFVAILSFGVLPAPAQTVGTAISATNALPNDNAMLDVQSPASGDGKGLLVPRVTAAQRTTASAATAGGLLDDSGDLRGGAAQGLLVYQTDGTQGFYYNTSATATPSWSFVGNGDFMADGSVAMTGDLDAGGNAVTNALYYGDGSGLTNIPSGGITEVDPIWTAASNAVATDISSRLASNVWASADSTTNYASRVDWAATNAGLQAQIDSAGTGDFKADGSVAMTGALNMSDQVISNVGDVIYFNSFPVGVGKLANPGGGGVAVGYMADGNFDGAAVGNQANGYIAGAVLGHQARGDWYGSSVGGNANAQYSGVSAGYYANGSLTNVAVGYYANAQGGSERIAIGHLVTNTVDNSAAIRGNLYLDGATNVMVRSTFGSGAWTPLVGAAGDFKSDGSVAMTGNLNMGGQDIIGVASNIAFASDEIAIGKDATADYGFDGVAVGSAAKGDYMGVGVGYQANGTFGGASMGYQARSYYYGVAMGYQAFATNHGAAVGREANAVSFGAALGSNAKAQFEGAAVGGSANGIKGGVAVGYYANGLEGGVAIGYDANGASTNIAIGQYASTYDSDHLNGGDRIAIGREVTNTVEDSCMIRGTLYLDGGTGVMYRSTFQSGGWTALGGGGGGISSYGYCYQLATGGNATVAGGADVPFSNNGPLSGITHTATTTTMTVPNTGTYKIEYAVTITAGVGAQMALAVNGVVDASTAVDFLVATGNISGTAMLTLAAGDVITLRNNSATPFTLNLSPATSAQVTITQMN
jgi:hypothetical protein